MADTQPTTSKQGDASVSHSADSGDWRLYVSDNEVNFAAALDAFAQGLLISTSRRSSAVGSDGRFCACGVTQTRRSSWTGGSTRCSRRTERPNQGRHSPEPVDLHARGRTGVHDNLFDVTEKRPSQISGTRQPSRI